MFSIVNSTKLFLHVDINLINIVPSVLSFFSVLTSSLCCFCVYVRLASLQKSGDEAWRRRIGKSDRAPAAAVVTSLSSRESTPDPGALLQPNSAADEVWYLISFAALPPTNISWSDVSLVLSAKI